MTLKSPKHKHSIDDATVAKIGNNGSKSNVIGRNANNGGGGGGIDINSVATAAALAKAKEVIRAGGTQAEAAAAAKDEARIVLKKEQAKQRAKNASAASTASSPTDQIADVGNRPPLYPASSPSSTSGSGGGVLGKFRRKIKKKKGHQQQQVQHHEQVKEGGGAAPNASTTAVARNGRSELDTPNRQQQTVVKAEKSESSGSSGKTSKTKQPATTSTISGVGNDKKKVSSKSGINPSTEKESAPTDGRDEAESSRSKSNSSERVPTKVDKDEREVIAPTPKSKNTKKSKMSGKKKRGKKNDEEKNCGKNKKKSDHPAAVTSPISNAKKTTKASTKSATSKTTNATGTERIKSKPPSKKKLVMTPVKSGPGSVDESIVTVDNTIDKMNYESEHSGSLNSSVRGSYESSINYQNTSGTMGTEGSDMYSYYGADSYTVGTEVLYHRGNLPGIYDDTTVDTMESYSRRHGKRSGRGYYNSDPNVMDMLSMKLFDNGDKAGGKIQKKPPQEPQRKGSADLSNVSESRKPEKKASASDGDDRKKKSAIDVVVDDVDEEGAGGWCSWMCCGDTNTTNDASTYASNGDDSAVVDEQQHKEEIEGNSNTDVKRSLSKSSGIKTNANKKTSSNDSISHQASKSVSTAPSQDDSSMLASVKMIASQIVASSHGSNSSHSGNSSRASGGSRSITRSVGSTFETSLTTLFTKEGTIATVNTKERTIATKSSKSTAATKSSKATSIATESPKDTAMNKSSTSIPSGQPPSPNRGDASVQSGSGASVTSGGATSVSSKMKTIFERAMTSNRCYNPEGGLEANSEIQDSGDAAASANEVPTKAPSGSIFCAISEASGSFPANWRDTVGDTAPAPPSAHVPPSTPVPSPRQQFQNYQTHLQQHPQQHKYHQQYPSSPSAEVLDPQVQNGAMMAPPTNPQPHQAMSQPQAHYEANQYASPQNSAMAQPINSYLSEESVDVEQDRYAGMAAMDPAETSTGGYTPVEPNGYQSQSISMYSNHAQSNGLHHQQQRQQATSPALQVLMSVDSGVGNADRYGAGQMGYNAYANEYPQEHDLVQQQNYHQQSLQFATGNYQQSSSNNNINQVMIQHDNNAHMMPPPLPMNNGQGTQYLVHQHQQGYYGQHYNTGFNPSIPTFAP